MTQVATTLRSAYLAGPMRGYEEYNFPAFRKATAWLRGLGWEIFSPAERDEADPAIDHTVDVAGWQGTRGLDYFMAYDLKAVCETDAVICLPDWEDSQGARLETVTAVEVGHPVFVIREGKTRSLKSVDPDYVLSVFAARGRPALWLSAEEIRPYPDSFLDLLKEAGRSKPKARDPLGCGHGPLEFTDPGVGKITDLSVEDGVLTIEGESGTVQVDSALPVGSEARKGVPLARGVLDYFPAALAEVARVSKAGNDKHNPGQDMHHARGKSTDHADCLLRHLVDRGKVDPETGMRHSGEVAWRALALLQQELEDAGLAPLPRGARLPELEEDE